MTKTPSSMIPLGTIAPDFTLVDTVSGKNLRLAELRSDIATVIIFMCNHCPFVKHIQSELINLANEYLKKGIRFIAISSNDVENYPDDAPVQMKTTALLNHFPFPYLYDETQDVARAYHAACTPDFYLFDKDLKCVYRGQFDDARPMNSIPVSGNDLRKALDQLLAGLPIDSNQKPSLGCNIKWKT